MLNWKLPLRILKLLFTFACYYLCAMVLVSNVDWVSWEKVEDTANKCQRLRSLVKSAEISFDTKAEFVASFSGEECSSQKNDTPLYLASVTKHLTGFAITQFVKEGELSRNDHVCSVLKASGCSEYMQSVTVGELLTHTSGMGRMTDAAWKDFFILFGKAFFSREFNQSETLFKQGRRYEKGTYHYSNLGYRLLAMVVDKKLKDSEQSWRGFFKKHGLANFQMSSAEKPYSRGRVSIPFVLWPKYSLSFSNRFTSMGVDTFGSGNFVVSARALFDWQKLNREFFEGHQVKNGYDIGILEEEFQGKRYWWHNGASLFAQSLFIIDQDSNDHIVVIFDSNSVWNESRKRVDRELRNFFWGKEYYQPEI